MATENEGKPEAAAWSWLLPGLGGGLCVARVVAEFGPLALPWWGVASLAAICALLGAALARWAQRRADLRPLLIAWAYVIYPALDAGVAIGVGFVALVGTVIASAKTTQPNKPSPRSGLTLPVLVFALAFALYLVTLAPDLLTADNAEYQLVAHHLGVAHPPGYALYTLLGKLFTLLPFNTPAWGVNLFAAVTGALTLALVSRTVQRLTGSVWGSAAAALALGVAPTFWAQSTTANIRSLMIFFTAWCFDALVAFGQALQRKETGQRALAWFALGLGLGIGHHFSLGMLLPAFAAYLLVADPSLARQPRRWLWPGLIFASTFVVLAYFPIRGAMGAVLAPDHLTTLSGFLEHVLAQGFGGDMFAFLRWGVLPHRFTLLGDILLFQFGGPLLVTAGLGGLALLWRNRRSFLLFGFGFGLYFFLVATYRAPQTVEYLMPAYVPLAVAVGYAVDTMAQAGSPSKDAGVAGSHAVRGSGPPAGALLVALILLPGVLRLADHYPSFAILHRDRTGRQYAEPILRAAPPNAVILSNWHWWTAFQYLQLSEGLRSDVKVIYVFPQGESYAANWTACIEGRPTAQPECLAANFSARPLIVTDQYDDFASLPYNFVPLGQAYLVQREPLTRPPSGLASLDAPLEGHVRLVGYRLSADALVPGQPLTVHLAWQSLAEWEHDYSFFVQLLGPAGLVGQGRDVIHPAGRYRVGQVLVDRFEVAVWPMVTPGDYTLVAGVYFVPPEGGWQRLKALDGQDHVSLGSVCVAAPTSPPVTSHLLRHRFVEGLALVGADFDQSPSQPQRVYLHWQLPAETGGDYSIGLLADGQSVAQGYLPALADGGYLTTAHDVPGGSLAVMVGRAGDAASLHRIGAWGLPSSRPLALPDPRPGSRFVPLGGEMALVGAQTRRGTQLSAAERRLLGAAERDGDILQVDLRWLSLGALTRDRVVSIQAPAVGAQHDSVPALGTVPTLKWIRGTTLRDRHFLVLPHEASGEVDLSLIVYDHFTHQPLALLDDRLAKLGNMTPLK
jgi:hypothetical protein